MKFDSKITMRVNLRLIAHGLLAISAFMFVPLIGCTNESNPSPLSPADPQPVAHADSQPVVHVDSLPAGHFPLGPFYGFDSLRHYEYGKTSYSRYPGLPIPDSGRVTEIGYLVDVQAPALDTIRLRIGTRRLRERYVGGERDSTYDTLYSDAAYIWSGNSFQALDPLPPFPFLDQAYVNASDTILSGSVFGTGFRINNLEAALHGEPAECTHIFANGYDIHPTGGREALSNNARAGRTHLCDRFGGVG